MKKVGVFLLALVIGMIFLSPMVFAGNHTEEDTDVAEAIGNLSALFGGENESSGLENEDEASGLEKVEKIKEDIEDIVEGKKWEYLGEKWKEILLRNKFVSFVDSGFRKFNFAFVILFDEDYDLSLILLMTIGVWIFFFVAFSDLVLISYSTFSDSVSYIVAFLIAVISAHLGFYRGISEVLFKVIFFRTGIWPWIFGLLMVLAWFTLIALLRGAHGMVAKGKKKRKQEKKVGTALVKAKHAEETTGMLVKALSPLSGGSSSSISSKVEGAVSAIGGAKTLAEVKSIFRKFAKVFHPDKGGSNADMSALSSAYGAAKKKFRKK